MADSVTDLGAMFGGMESTTQVLFLLAVGIIGLIVFAVVAMVIINRSSRIPYKIDLKDRHTGVLKYMPFSCKIYIRRGDGSIPIKDKWGYTTLRGERVAVLKFAGFTFPAPLFEDIEQGNFLTLYSPNNGEVYPVRFDEKTLHLSASVRYDVVGHVYNRYKAHKELFTRPSQWDRIYPILTIMLVGMVCIVMVFFTVKFLTDKIDLIVAASNQAATALGQCKQTITPAPPPA